MSEKTGMRSGYVAVIGRPNVGKSTLINKFMGQKIAAVSAKPQTTRRRQLGILTEDQAQIIFVDTPGLHIPQHKLGDFMNQEATEGLLDADLILWLLDSTSAPTNEDTLIAEKLRKIKDLPPVLIALSKNDLIDEQILVERKNSAIKLFPAKDILSFSSSSGLGLEDLKNKIIEFLPIGDAFFDAETITDYFERDIAAELVREAVLFHVRDEVPHCIAVRVDGYKERENDKAYIEATIFVERDSQKGILIGQNGEMIKKIGILARQEIESMSGKKVYLDLRIKVNKNWRNSPDALQWLGYAARGND